MHTLRLFVVLLLGGACAPAALAGGTIGFDELEPLLVQRPELFATLKADYSLPDSAFAEVRLGPHFKHLSGARTGPYVFYAQKRSEPTALKVQVLVCTQVDFVSPGGKALAEPQWDKAVRIREKLVSVSFHVPDAKPVCAK